MVASDQQRWLGSAILVGAVYLIIGVAFGALAGGASSHQMRSAWRLGAWLGSAVVFGAHIWREHVRLHHSPPATALHASVAAALGAFGLAAAANVHALVTSSGNLRLLHLSLLVWPIVTGVPAFAVALATTAALAWGRGRRRAP